MKNRHGARLIRMLAGLHTRPAAGPVLTEGTVFRRRLRLLILLPLPHFFTALYAQGQEAVRDTLSIRFRLDSTRVDLGYAGERAGVGGFPGEETEQYRSCAPVDTRVE